MSDLFTAFETFLRNDDWHFHSNGEDTINFNLSGDSTDYAVTIIVSDTIALVYFNNPYKIPEAKRTEMCEFVARANFGLKLGNFELDLNDGEMRYKTSMKWTEDYMPGDDAFKSMISVNFSTIDRYFPGVNAVVYGSTPAKKAIEDIESK